jgi:hypothetical protein
MWRTVYNNLFYITTSLLQADNVPVELTLPDDTETAMDTKLPSYIFHVDGLVLMRGDLNTVWAVSRNSTHTVRLWNPTFYGSLPYTIGFVAAGPNLHVMAIQKCDQSLQRTTILLLDINFKNSLLNS